MDIGLVEGEVEVVLLRGSVVDHISAFESNLLDCSIKLPLCIVYCDYLFGFVSEFCFIVILLWKNLSQNN